MVESGLNDENLKKASRLEQAVARIEQGRPVVRRLVFENIFRCKASRGNNVKGGNFKRVKQLGGGRCEDKGVIRWPVRMGKPMAMNRDGGCY